MCSLVMMTSRELLGKGRQSQASNIIGGKGETPLPASSEVHVGREAALQDVTV